MENNIGKISDAEAEIMKVIWDSKQPVPYSYIRSVLTKQVGWESPTINTLVNRLVKKGVLEQEKRDVYYYSPTVTEEQYMKAKTKSFVQKVYSGNVKGLISALLKDEGISNEDLEDIRDFWNKGRNKK